MADLKAVYQATSLETAEYKLAELAEKWDKYSAAVKP
jgi:hypothetical protein